MSTSLIFTGDIGFDKYMDGKWRDQELLSQEVLAFLHSGDHVIVNVEGPVVAKEAFQAKEGTAQLLHSMDPDVVSVLQKMHADIWNLNNNHIMDAGQEGLMSTLKLAEDQGVRTLGVGKNLQEASQPLILPEDGGIGLLSVGYERACRIATKEAGGCLNFSRMDLVEEGIRKIKKTCRWCIVVAHDGEEFSSLPTSYVRDRYHRYLELGADLVVAHHPHVPMNYERVGDKAIFYSLGNFIFDTPYQRSQFHTDQGILLKLTFSDREGSWKFEAEGIRIDRETERISISPLPAIFENVPEEEYRLLAPLAARTLIANTRRQLLYLRKDQFEKATEEDWRAEFLKPLRSGKVPGQLLDFGIILSIAEEEKAEDIEKSRLTGLVDYMRQQLF